MNEAKWKGLKSIPPNYIFALVSISLFFFSWGRWVEFWGDSGFNLYTFWQISEGKVLFRDLYYVHGPLSPLLCGLLFRLFGTSIFTIAIFNLLMTWGVSLILYSILKKMFSARTAFLSVIYFFCAFAFAQNSLALSFNFIFPYKQEAIHGIFASLLCLLHLQQFLSENKRRNLFAIGFFWSITLLLSLEFFFATSLAVVFSCIFFQNYRRDLSVLGLGLIAPVLISTAYFLSYFSFGEALKATFSTVVNGLNSSSVLSNRMYSELLGTDNTYQNLLSMGIASFCVGVFIGALLYSNLLVKKWFLFIVPILIIAPLLNFEDIWWAKYPKIFPIFLLIFLLLVLKDLAMKVKLKLKASHEIFSASFLLFCFGMLSKMLLNPRIGYYGFLLTMPTAMALVGFFTHYLPDRLHCDKKMGQVFMVLIGSLSLSHLIVTNQNHSFYNFVAGTGADRGLIIGPPYADDAGVLLGLSVKWVQENVKKEEKIMILPDADMINYLARRERPISMNFGGFLFSLLGEDFLLEQLKAAAPSFIGIASNSYHGMGYGLFGVDPNFGLKTKLWIENNYVVAKKFGGSVFDTKHTGMIFYRIKPAFSSKK